MVNIAINRSNPICLVGGGRLEPGDLELACNLTDAIVAVDGGAARVLETGRVPDAVIGDFDSLCDDMRAQLDPATLHKIDEQDSTDFEKALMRVAAPLIVAVGFTGARIDHELAVLHALLAFQHVPCVLLAEREVIMLCPPRLELAMTAGETVSLFPLVAVQGRSVGLEWPIKGLQFAPGRKIGTSNRATGGQMVLEAEGPGLLALLPRGRLGDVIKAMLDRAPGPGRWPSL